VVTVRVVVWVTTGAGLAAATWVVCFTVRVLVDVDVVSAGVDVSVVAGAVSTVGAGVALTAGAGSVVVGCAS
jgi:hypothetical protein